jgi:hypothetical protein
VLEDNDLVHLKDGAYALFNTAERQADGGGGDGEARKPVAVSRALQTLEMEVSQIMKVGVGEWGGGSGG